MPDVAISTPAIVSIVATVGLVVSFVLLLKARREQRHVDALFRGLMDATGFGVLIVSTDDVISYANEAAVGMLGYPLEQLVGSDKHALLHQGADIETPGEECALRAALRNGERYFGHEQFVDARRNLVPVTVSSAPLPGGGGSALLFRDRSTEVAQERERVQSFALISHELRSPLTTVVGFSNRLQRSVLAGRLQVPEQYAEEIELLAREASRMRDIVTVVLDVATLERRLEIQAEPISMPRLVREETERLAREQPGTVFACEGVADVAVESDERYVRRILQNLLENARKYAGESGPVEVMAEERDNGVALTVRDHGPGVALESQPRIFDRFYRQETTAGARPGLGLGLFLSRQLALRLGGQLTVESRPGAGAAFTLWLPGVPPDRLPEVPPTRQATAELNL